MKSKNSDIPSFFFLSYGKCITESTAIGNIFNDFFILLHLKFNQKLSFIINHLKIFFLQRAITCS